MASQVTSHSIQELGPLLIVPEPAERCYRIPAVKILGMLESVKLRFGL